MEPHAFYLRYRKSNFKFQVQRLSLNSEEQILFMFTHLSKEHCIIIICFRRVKKPEFPISSFDSADSVQLRLVFATEVVESHYDPPLAVVVDTRTGDRGLAISGSMRFDSACAGADTASRSCGCKRAGICIVHEDIAVIVRWNAVVAGHRRRIFLLNEDVGFALVNAAK